jgi:hypothetical protein
LGKLPSDTPPSICNLVERCLDRNVKNRLRDIGEARVIIERVGLEPAAPRNATAPALSRTGKAAWVIAGLFILATAVLAVIHFREIPLSRDTASRTNRAISGSAARQDLRPHFRVFAQRTHSGVHRV